MTAEDIHARVREDGLLAPGRPVVVLLSGGRDSTCLLDLAVRIAGAESVRALHVNYGIRESADEDERHCHELCATLGVRMEVRRPTSPATGNLQAWAREARYRAALELAAGADVEAAGDVAAGHTKTDQVETILYRLASSPSRRALLGMRPRDGSVVRPLLAFTRAETAAYCAARGLRWREDESNASDAYARNRIRATLVPALEDVHPAAVDNVLAVAQVLRGEADVLDALIDEVLGGRPTIALERLRAIEPALRRLVVQRLADEAAGGFAPGTGGRADEIVALSDRGTALLDVGNGLRAVVEYGELRFERLGSDPRTADARAAGDPGNGVVRSVRGAVRARRARPRAGRARSRRARPRGARALLARRRPDGAARPRRDQEPPGPLHRTPGPAGGASRRAGDRSRRRNRMGRGGGDLGALQGNRRDASGGQAACAPRPIDSRAVEGDDAIGEILVPAEDLRRRVRELAEEVSRDYQGKDLVLVGVLKGAVLFLSDLMRHLEVPCEVDFMAVASYGSATKSSGVVRILKDLDAVIEGRDVLIVEDIVDSGLTLQYLLRNLEGRNPRSLEVCALLVKPERQKVDLRTKYVGFEIPNRFVVGYGLDYAERYRNLPYVAELNE